jgi:hypothetical protein
MNSTTNIADSKVIQTVINIVNNIGDSDHVIEEEIEFVKQLSTDLTVINQSNNSELKYRYPYITGLRTPTLAEPVTKEKLLESDINTDCWAYNELLDSAGFYKLTQLQPPEFIELLNIIRPIINVTPIESDSRISDENIVNSINNARPTMRKFQPADRLLCWLIQLTGERDIIMARIFNSGETTIFRNFKFITSIVNSVLEDEIKWPDQEERKLLYDMFPIYSKAIAVVDGTHCEVKIPGDLDDEDSFYSGYKHKHTQLYLVYIDPHGFFRRIEGPWEGSNVDRGVFTQSEIYTNTKDYLAGDEKILADGGFAGDGPLIFPYNKTDLAKSGDKKEELQAYNELLTESRSLVEHAIHRLKARATILVGRYPKNKQQQFEIVKAAAILFNWTRRIRIIKQQKDRSNISTE